MFNYYYKKYSDYYGSLLYFFKGLLNKKFEGLSAAIAMTKNR
ncbi:hypothetical protein [Amazonocrinis nigriterrae]|nr:hypothetical protein [Amazonocrinis nigriterrae]